MPKDPPLRALFFVDERLDWYCVRSCMARIGGIGCTGSTRRVLFEVSLESDFLLALFILLVDFSILSEYS